MYLNEDYNRCKEENEKLNNIINNLLDIADKEKINSLENNIKN